MDWNFLITFVVLSIINVVFSTVRTIVTINGGKLSASLLSGGYFAFYNIMMIYTVADFPMWQKCLITFICNVIGVFVVKWGEEKARKDKLWKIEATVTPAEAPKLMDALNASGIPYNYIDVKKYVIFNIYSATQGETIRARELLADAKAKYFISESKT